MSSEEEAPLRARARAALAWLAAPLAVGAALRLWNLHRQALLGDELHALRRALREPVGAILFHYRIPDSSLPLTALTRLLLDRGVVIDEWILRAPCLLAGWLLAAIGGLFLARREGAMAGAVFAGLAASSPLLVIYSRNARPYAFAATLSFAALVLFIDAWERRSKARFAGAALVGAIAVWSLPTALAVVGAPWAAALVATVLERRRGGSWRSEFLAVAGSLVVAAAILAIPAWRSLRLLIRYRGAELDSSETGAIPEGLLLAAGARLPLIGAAIVVGGVAGLVLLVRRRGFAGTMVASTFVAHLLGMAVLRDRSFEYAMGVARTLMLGIPELFCGVALVAAALVPRRWRERAGAAIVAGAVCALVPAAAGPLPERLGAAPELLSSIDRMRFTLQTERFAAPLPGIYAREPLASARRIVDAPILTEAWFVRPVVGEVLVHRRPVLLGVLDPLPPARVRLRASLAIAPERILASSGDALLFRLRLGEQAKAIDDRIGSRHLKRDLKRLPELAAAAERVRGALLAAYGPPDASDADYWVWDLRRLRRQRLR